LRVFYGKIQLLLLLPGLLGSSGAAKAVTQYEKVRKPFLFDITTFTTTLNLPVTDQVETVKMSNNQMQKRIAKSPTDETIEPLSIILNDNDTNISTVAEKLAASGKFDELSAYFREKLKTAKPVKKGASSKTIEIDADGLALIDNDAFADMYSKTHHILTINSKELRADATAKTELMKQLSPYLKKKDREKLLKKINAGEPVSVNKDMLPEFARKMVGKFIVQRGPNCFHAALAFHGPKMTASSLINVKSETGYHRAMINYDELWRVLNQNFYEVDPDSVPLKYGDMLVFFDVPEDIADDLKHPVDFKWIRHTATYLFGGYTFSKGSKSPNTPYTVRTMADEWRTWKKYTKNLGIKVFRRSTAKVRPNPPMDLVDWVY
jgi:hypothetical protein